MAQIYDRIGRGYAATRRADPRIARAIHEALGNARTILNVGAGTGSYEPRDRFVVAIEPSIEMLRQRPHGSAPAAQAAAEHLPIPDRSFDAAMAILTVHHWNDQAAGLAELRRVARRAVILTWTFEGEPFWLTADYLPEILELDRKRLPPIAEFVRDLGSARVQAVLIPHDCEDGFLTAFWRRPEAYLDPNVRRAISPFGVLAPEIVRKGIARLDDDLRSGRWEARWGHLRERESIDLGNRLVVTDW